jgi:hypothetical protein
MDSTLESGSPNKNFKSLLFGGKTMGDIYERLRAEMPEEDPEV